MRKKPGGEDGWSGRKRRETKLDLAVEGYMGELYADCHRNPLEELPAIVRKDLGSHFNKV